MTASDRTEIKDLIKEGNNSLKDIFKATIGPLQREVLSNSEGVKEVPILKERVDAHLLKHTSKLGIKRFNIEMWVVVCIFIADKLYQHFTMV